MITRVRTTGILMLVGVCFLTACATTPSPTVVELTVSATRDLNPGADGQPLPVIVRLYRMRSAAAFDRAEFEQLYEQEMATIGGDLVGTVEFVFFPGQTETITRAFLPEERFLGVAAAFRNSDSVAFRASTPVPGNTTSRFQVRLDRGGISIQPST